MEYVLETERLALRELEPDDLEFLVAMMGHPDVNRYYERPFDRRDCTAWLEKQLQRYHRDGHGLWLVLDRADEKPMGQVGLMIQQVEEKQFPEIGWLLHRPYWGHGYATEAAAGVRDAAFSVWNYPAVISLIRPENVPSQHVAQRIGMAPGPEVDFHGYRHIMYGVSAPEE